MISPPKWLNPDAIAVDDAARQTYPAPVHAPRQQSPARTAHEGLAAHTLDGGQTHLSHRTGTPSAEPNLSRFRRYANPRHNSHPPQSLAAIGKGGTEGPKDLLPAPARPASGISHRAASIVARWALWRAGLPLGTSQQVVPHRRVDWDHYNWPANSALARLLGRLCDGEYAPIQTFASFLSSGYSRHCRCQQAGPSTPANQRHQLHGLGQASSADRSGSSQFRLETRIDVLHASTTALPARVESAGAATPRTSVRSSRVPPSTLWDAEGGVNQNPDPTNWNDSMPPLRTRATRSVIGPDLRSLIQKRAGGS